MENEQWSGVDVENERVEFVRRKSDEDIYLCLAKKNLFYVFVLY